MGLKPNKPAADGEITVVFRASQVEWAAGTGVSCKEPAATGQFLVGIVNHDNVDTRIIGPQQPEIMSGFRISGDLLFFGKDGELVTTGAVGDWKGVVKTT